MVDWNDNYNYLRQMYDGDLNMIRSPQPCRYCSKPCQLSLSAALGPAGYLPVCTGFRCIMKQFIDMFTGEYRKLREIERKLDRK